MVARTELYEISRSRAFESVARALASSAGIAGDSAVSAVSGVSAVAAGAALDAASASLVADGSADESSFDADGPVSASSAWAGAISD